MPNFGVNPRGVALWGSVKENMRRGNGLATGAPREGGASSASDGADLIGDAPVEQMLDSEGADSRRPG